MIRLLILQCFNIQSSYNHPSHFCRFSSFFLKTDGTGNLLPSPPSRIKLPRNLKGSVHSLPSNEKSVVASVDVIGNADNSFEKYTLIVKA